MTDWPGNPFTRNKTDMKRQARSVWLEIEECEDADQLSALLDCHEPFLSHVRDLADQDLLPEWWYGGGDNPGLEQHITNRKAALGC